jgi:hypothetical protein
MASKEELEKLSDKYAEDEDFREKFKADPVATASSMGIELTDEQVQKIEAHRMNAEKVGTRESKSVLMM